MLICPISDPVRSPPAYRPNDPYETSGIQAGVQLPRWMWRVMFGCYAIFFVTVAAATGHDTATVMMIVISILYVVMVFGTTGILNAQKGPEYDSPLDRVGGVLETRTGPGSEKHKSELPSLMRISYALFRLKKKNK